MANRYLQLVQIGRRDLAMEEDAYRALLQRVTGKRSAKGLSDKALSRVLDEMKRLGFKPKPGKKTKLSPPSSATVRAAETTKIRAIWITMANQGFIRNRSEDAIDAYAKRMTATVNNGIGVGKAAWLDPHQAYMVLEALKKWHTRLMVAALEKRSIRVPMNDKGTGPAGYEDLSLYYDGMTRSKTMTNQKPVQ